MASTNTQEPYYSFLSTNNHNMIGGYGSDAENLLCHSSMIQPQTDDHPQPQKMRPRQKIKPNQQTPYYSYSYANVPASFCLRNRRLFMGMITVGLLISNLANLRYSSSFGDWGTTSQRIDASFFTPFTTSTGFLADSLIQQEKRIKHRGNVEMTKLLSPLKKLSVVFANGYSRTNTGDGRRGYQSTNASRFFMPDPMRMISTMNISSNPDKRTDTNTLVLTTRDYGGLALSFPAFRRGVWVPYNNVTGKDQDHNNNPKEHPEPRFRRGPDALFDDEFLGYQQCRRTNWMSKHFPVCNALHEITMLEEPSTHRTTRSNQGRRTASIFSVVFTGHGRFRDAWAYLDTSTSRPFNSSDSRGQGKNRNNKNHNHNNNKNDSSFTMKRFRYVHGTSVDELHDQWHTTRKEALILERLTRSPRIINVYGHCGTTILVEYAPVGANNRILHKGGGMDQTVLDLLQTQDVHPMNDLTVVEKLDYAIEMSKAIAEVHGFEGGLVTHGDLGLDQYLMSRDHQMVLNDFNLGKVFEYDEEHQRYCANNAVTKDAVHKDLLRYGYILYSLLTGLKPWYRYRNLQVGKKEEGPVPFVDERYRSRSPIEAGLVRIMEKAWNSAAADFSIFDAIRQLQALKETTASASAENATSDANITGK